LRDAEETVIILGLNAYHGDSSSCLVVNGELVAAAEEERFRRVKHWAGFPSEAIRYCLRQAAITIDEVDCIAINRNPAANLLRKAHLALARGIPWNHIQERLTNLGRIGGIKTVISSELGCPTSSIKARVVNVEHHRAHLASSFFVSPFPSAAVVSLDGFGDFTSTMWGEGKDSRITVRDQVHYPHSLGLAYLAVTQFIGFPHYGDEYKVMGLAPLGRPTELDALKRVVRLKSRGRFELELKYFLHHSKGVSMVWDHGQPSVGRVYSDEMARLLGPARKQGEALTDRHRNIAASLQSLYEETFFHLLDHVFHKTRSPVLCLAGGCALNSVANGKIFDQTAFKDLYVQSAAGDAGGAIGAAFHVWHQELGHPRGFVMENAYCGPSFSPEEVRELLERRRCELDAQGCRVRRVDSEAELCRLTAERLATGKVVGWFQGRMEWGPRALGNRSIVCDPRRANMKDILNQKIKRRESFRPFAPSILREAVRDWFETDCDVPFMLQIHQVRRDRRPQIPAVTHVDGSGRLQTVTERQNPRFYRLIKSFGETTGVPLVLNTSFNENEPIVCTPGEALDCFLRTGMDVLVLENFFMERSDG
jgi:carbamoyltransferase